MEFSLCCQVIGCHNDWMKYEYLALKRSCRLHIAGGGLFTILKLALLLAYMKLCLGSFSLATRVGKLARQLVTIQVVGIGREASSCVAFFAGYRAHEMCVLLKKPKLDYGCLADLFSALFFSTRYFAYCTFWYCLKQSECLSSGASFHINCRTSSV